ncbi:MAG TPA: hypothetical protein VF630_18390 [Hymenobacter sp.]|jgi:hypothetical protein
MHLVMKRWFGRYHWCLGGDAQRKDNSRAQNGRQWQGMLGRKLTSRQDSKRGQLIQTSLPTLGQSCEAAALLPLNPQPIAERREQTGTV